MSARGMFDFRCSKCRGKISWGGSVRDAPPCPRCGARLDPVELGKVEAELETAREMMTAETSRTQSGKTEAVWIQDWDPSAYIYVGRENPRFPGQSTFGNPFSSQKRARGTFFVGSIQESVDFYRRWLEGYPIVAQMLDAFGPGYPERRLAILAGLPSLRGHRLGCWKHDGPCHARVLAELADGPLGEPSTTPTDEV